MATSIDKTEVALGDNFLDLLGTAFASHEDCIDFIVELLSENIDDILVAEKIAEDLIIYIAEVLNEDYGIQTSKFAYHKVETEAFFIYPLIDETVMDYDNGSFEICPITMGLIASHFAINRTRFYESCYGERRYGFAGKLGISTFDLCDDALEGRSDIPFTDEEIAQIANLQSYISAKLA